MDRVVDIATDDLHLSAFRGFLVVSLDRQEQGRIALDDIQALIVHAHGVTRGDRTMNLSGYRLMWIFVMFDLPVDTTEHTREATKFREFLLDEGFEMSQFSIYALFCNGKEHFETYLRRIEANLPERGEIHVLNFTDKQYENIIRFSSQRRQRQRKNPDQLALF